MNTLTSPNDKTGIWKATKAPPLTDDETQLAMSDLSVDCTLNYPKLERMYADPLIIGQKYSLVSFIPSTEASPDKDGVYGMIKVRGNFDTIEEANQKAEFLVQNVDSYHKIYHCFTGRPFPATNSSKFSHETAEVDVRKKITSIVNGNIKQQKAEENKVINEIKDRERELLEESKRAKEGIPEDPLDEYTKQRVKYAQLVWTYKETQKRLEKVKKVIIKTRETLKESDESNPEFLEQYREKYMKARTDAGLVDDSDDSFLQYLGKDIELDF